MTEETKKQILLHLPYLFFVYLFDKIAQGFRLSYGTDMGTRLLHFPKGMTEAFSSPLISFHLSDLFIGVIAAALIRLTVYVKGKNIGKEQSTDPPVLEIKKTLSHTSILSLEITFLLQKRSALP